MARGMRVAVYEYKYNFNMQVSASDMVGRFVWRDKRMRRAASLFSA